MIDIFMQEPSFVLKLNMSSAVFSRNEQNFERLNRSLTTKNNEILQLNNYTKTPEQVTGLQI